VEGRVKVRDGAVVVGPFDVQAPCGAVRGVAQLALKAGVRLHGGVACPELVGKPFEGVRDADAEGAEALAVAFEGHLKGGSAANEVVWMLCPKTFLSTCVNRRLHSLIFQRQSTP